MTVNSKIWTFTDNLTPKLLKVVQCEVDNQIRQHLDPKQVPKQFYGSKLWREKRYRRHSGFLAFKIGQALEAQKCHSKKEMDAFGYELETRLVAALKALITVPKKSKDSKTAYMQLIEEKIEAYIRDKTRIPTLVEAVVTAHRSRLREVELRHSQDAKALADAEQNECDANHKLMMEYQKQILARKKTWAHWYHNQRRLIDPEIRRFKALRDRLMARERAREQKQAAMAVTSAKQRTAIGHRAKKCSIM